MKPFHVYMLRCADDSYYVGHTDDLQRRVAQHEAGEIEGCYTHRRRPVALVWSQETATREEALAAERRIKGWARAKKDALVRGDWAAIERHAWGTRNPLPQRLRCEAGPSIPQDERRPSDGRPSIPQDERGVTAGAQDAQVVALTGALLGPAGPAQRRALAKAITLVESTRADHRARADALLDAMLPHAGQAFRIGISGVPGVGKSTFIEALGLFLVGHGHRVAVLAVDPSSSVSGGSILGDKTRMERLSVHERAFIRPSPASGTLGGVAEKTREALLLCEAAGHDVVIVETVGVGQSETAVAGMTDLFVLLQLPNAGDDLQAIKKGVMELADLVVVNKADLDEDAATRARAQITSALRILGPHGHAAEKVLQLSAAQGTGLAEFWQTASEFHARRRANGALAQRRRRQDEAWMWERIEAGLRERFRHHPAVRKALPGVSEDVRAGRLAASVAARRLLQMLD